MNKIRYGVYNGCEWIGRLALVNVLWILFTLGGGIVVGLAPSTGAVFSIVRSWLKSETDISIVKHFLTYFKQNFFKANLLALPLAVLSGILIINIRILELYDGFFPSSIRMLLIVVLWLYLIMVIYLFPLFVNYQFNILTYYKYAFSLIVFYPLRTVFVLICCSIIYLINYAIPGLLPFFSVSLAIALMMWNSWNIFSEMDEKSNIEVSN